MPRVTVPFTMTVEEAPPVVGTFVVTIDPTALSVPAGTDAAYTVSFSTLDGFAGRIWLNVLNLPEGASVGLAPNPAAVTDTVGLTIETTGVAPGVYNLELEAVEAGQAKLPKPPTGYPTYPPPAVDPLNPDYSFGPPTGYPTKSTKPTKPGWIS